jgi:hypothetical protein
VATEGRGGAAVALTATVVADPASAATTLLHDGVPITVVQKLLGYARLETTQISSHLMPGSDEMTRTAVDRALAEPSQRPSGPNGDPTGGQKGAEEGGSL